MCVVGRSKLMVPAELKVANKVWRTQSKIYIFNGKSKNTMSLFGSKAQEGVLSGEEHHQESREDCDCLRLSERRKKNSGGKKKKKKKNSGTDANLY